MTNFIQEYTKYTTVHGLYYIGRKLLTIQTRFVWLIIFLSCLTLCLYQSTISTRQYLEFHVQTSLIFEPIGKLEFPSITFCSPHFIKRSEVGNYSDAGPVLTFVLIGNDVYEAQTQNTDYGKINVQNSKTCTSDHRTKYTERAEKEGIYSLISDESTYDNFSRTVVKSYRDDFVKCWWKNKDIKCDEMFIDLQFDAQICYIFNAGKELSTVLSSFIENINQTNKNKSSVDLEILTKKTAHFLVNTNQSNYCGTGLIRDGAGLEAVLLEQDAMPLSNLNTPMKLSPGYVHNIIIKPRMYKRQTAHLGLCADNVEFSIFPNGNKYIRSACFMECLLHQILSKCRCLPGALLGYKRFLRNEKLQIPTTSLLSCGSSEGICASAIWKNFTQKNPIEKMCPNCKRQCLESQYRFSATQSLLPLNKLRNDVPQFKNVTMFNEIFLRKNFFYVSFSFESNYAEVVVEEQEIKLRDLFIAYGNNIGLFLGMSFMTLFEIFLELFCKSLIHCFQSFKKKLNKQHKRKGRKKIKLEQ